ncbi:Uncharacterized protein ycf54 [Ananas comosus]|uniref:Uncharacterized protein ycf54 n=1 Tax=Ananas comosus TaxID=4615 RepID=A0A199VTF5_ANACO|nr:Uncharacterized protein ycf54 [Ananas comosus]
MVAPATLALRPWLVPAPSRADRARSLHTFPILLPSTSVHLQSNGGATKLLSTCNRVSSIRAVAVDSDQLGSSEPPQQIEKPKKYYFVVANAKFMLDEEEHFKELLYEKLRLYGERNKEQDFWLVVEPKFLDKFPDITKRLKRPAAALVSTDRPWITFMKLRLDRVLSDSFDADTLKDALACNPVDLHFEKPENWTAPYKKYEFGWWGPFLPPPSI